MVFLLHLDEHYRNQSGYAQINIRGLESRRQA